MSAASLDPRSPLTEGCFYSNDNGRIHCHRRECAGRAAYFDGRCLSGHRLRRLSPAEAAAHLEFVRTELGEADAPSPCESCRARARAARREGRT